VNEIYLHVTVFNVKTKKLLVVDSFWYNTNFERRKYESLISNGPMPTFSMHFHVVLCSHC